MNSDKNFISSSKNDNLESILEKIKSGTNLEQKFKIYTLFYITQPGYRNAINMSLQIWEPELLKKVKKGYYPTLWDKLKNWIN